MTTSMSTMLRSLLLLPLLVSLVIAGTNEEGLEFLEKNKDAEGVITLESGLQYKVLRKGEGVYHPTVGAPCSCHYEGTLIDGTKFDSSYDRGSPTTFAPNQVIKGWTEAMQLMVEGDKWQMFIPSELGYGDNGSPPKIPGGSVLIFTMEILEIQGDKVPAMTCTVTLEGDTVQGTTGCNEKEEKYVEKIKAWEKKKVSTEIKRLGNMKDGKMKPELMAWIDRRVHILQQMPKEEGDEL
ncbi:FKBP-type 22 kDa peptidyl-prolyl cis-trans isomerase [Seminavis robusta]|uniref:peptidylprolyl isomerase n=1 Tax=Seminavis robusta TaxID=568900 RepID=A0A9N8H398_9STRA|nr:FKBP-type 22 kDa peptidyl-prolyl cis-trans isomerase [Seminavis robusta]|eukprot:Sro55_g032240.1 FKBP-type 22 kDa peptidyl-prolyl cis-trans isomerase (238) ;mRNA; f:40776-41809